jgi:hypothetical protein
MLLCVLHNQATAWNCPLVHPVILIMLLMA